MARTVKLDKTDIIILNMVMRDARTPFKDIAQACDLSRAAVHQRVHRMIDKGVILGSGYNVDFKKLGYSTSTYVGITLEKASQYHAATEELKKIPEVVECNYCTGPYTLLVKVYARDNDHLLQILNGKIQQIKGVNSTETMITLDQSFKRPLTLPDVRANSYFDALGDLGD